MFFRLCFITAYFEIVFPIDSGLFPTIVSLLSLILIFHDQGIHFSVPFDYTDLEACITAEVPLQIPTGRLRCEAGTTKSLSIQCSRESNLGGVLDWREIGLRRAAPDTIVNSCPVCSGRDPWTALINTIILRN